MNGFTLRRILVAASAAGLVAILVWAAAGLPQFGHYNGVYGTTIDTVGTHERHLPNVTTAVNFDYRGLDTLVEEFILFAAVAGLALVLRSDRRKLTNEALPSPPGRHLAERSEALRAFSFPALGFTVLFGMYIIIHAHLTPGGGFQGGAITGSALALVVLGVGFRTFARIVSQNGLEPLEAIGAAAYVVIGIATLGATGAFLANALPLDGNGRLFSAGTIPLINLFVGLEVAAGFALFFVEFARETRREVDEAPQ